MGVQLDVRHGGQCRKDRGPRCRTDTVEGTTLRELAALMSLLFAVAASLAVFAASRPTPGDTPSGGAVRVASVSR
jgi:hypothetical protein